MAKAKVRKWDVFISHASEDKDSFVEPLASALSQFGVSVWFDKFALRVGDSLSKSIDLGLANSQYGLVVLSPNFIAKRWPDYELRGMIAREISGKNPILPIWHNLSRRKLLKFNPTLADKFAIQSEGLTTEQIAIKIIGTVRPDIFRRIVSRITFKVAESRAERREEKIENLKSAPILHAALSPELIARIRLIRAALFEVHPDSMEAWIDGFKRDSHPSREIYIWEHMAAVYHEYLLMSPKSTLRLRKDVFSAVFQLSFVGDVKLVRLKSTDLKKSELQKIGELYSSTQPPYDIRKPSPYSDENNYSPEVLEMFRKIDKEDFYSDIPDALINKFIESQQKARSEKK